MQRLLFKTHIWLGWIIGVQLFLWMLSGLLMSAMPIGTVRGEHLRAERAAAPLDRADYVAPADILATTEADRLVLTTLLDRPVYQLEKAGNAVAVRDAITGAPVIVDADLAQRVAVARYAGTGSPIAVTWTAADDAPREFRRPVAAFAVTFDDAEGTVFYVNAITADIAAVRTDRWRLFDLMWGLHIMDWREREDFNHPLLIAAAALGTISVAGGIALLLLRQSRQKRRAPAAPPR